jgi:hypothetical protein
VTDPRDRRGADVRRLLRWPVLLPTVLVAWTLVVLSLPSSKPSCIPGDSACITNATASAHMARFALWVVGVGGIGLVTLATVALIAILGRK